MKVTKVTNTNDIKRIKRLTEAKRELKGGGICDIDWSLPKYDGEITDFRSEELQSAIERAELKNFNK